MSALGRTLRELDRRIASAAARGVVRRVDSSPKLQEIQVTVLRGEVASGVEHFEPAGFTSHPRAGAEAVLIYLGGSRSHPVAVVVSSREHRLKGLEAGATAIHNADGDRIVIRNNGTIEVRTSKSVDIVAPKVTIRGDVEITGNLTASGEVADALGPMSEMRTIYNSHTHSAGGNPPLQPMT